MVEDQNRPGRGRAGEYAVQPPKLGSGDKPVPGAGYQAVKSDDPQTGDVTDRGPFGAAVPAAARVSPGGAEMPGPQFPGECVTVVMVAGRVHVRDAAFRAKAATNSRTAR